MAVIDNTGFPDIGTVRGGKRELSIKGLKAGKAVITIFVSTTSTGGVLRTVGYYWLDVTVEDAGGGDVPIARASIFVQAWEAVVSFFSWVGSLFGICGSTLTLTNKTDVKDKKLPYGNSSVTVTGTITSTNGNITNVYAAIINTATNDELYPKSTNPRSTTFNLGTWDSAIKFSQLAVGSYKFVVKAKNADGEVTLQDDPFEVVGAAVTTPTPDASAAKARNKTSGKNSNIFQWPLTQNFTLGCPYGKHTCTWPSHNTSHTGRDVKSPPSIGGAAVTAMADGVIQQVYKWEEHNNGVDARGNFVIVRHTIGGIEYWTLYQHLSSRNSATDVMPGDEGKTIKKGQQIGRVGHTGSGDGDHLHFEVGVGIYPNGREEPMNYFN